jgi:hypothetical protein
VPLKFVGGWLLVGLMVLAILAQPIYNIILSGLLQENRNQDDDCEENDRHSPFLILLFRILVLAPASLSLNAPSKAKMRAGKK